MENPVKGLRYRQVDVFAARPTGEGAPAGGSAPASGNGLAVFWDCPRLSRATMQQLAVELRGGRFKRTRYWSSWTRGSR